MLRPARLWIYRLATCWMPETRLFGLKADLLHWCGAQVDTNVRLNSSVHITGDGQPRMMMVDNRAKNKGPSRNLQCVFNEIKKTVRTFSVPG